MELLNANSRAAVRQLSGRAHPHGVGLVFPWEIRDRAPSGPSIPPAAMEGHPGAARGRPMAPRDRGRQRNKAITRGKQLFSQIRSPFAHKSAMPTGTSLAHSAPVKCVLSLPDAAADAAPSSIHIAAGPVRAAVDRCKGFPGQLDWLHARSGGRRAHTVGQGLAP